MSLQVPLKLDTLLMSVNFASRRRQSLSRASRTCNLNRKCLNLLLFFLIFTHFSSQLLAGFFARFSRSFLDVLMTLGSTTDTDSGSVFFCGNVAGIRGFMKDCP